MSEQLLTISQAAKFLNCHQSSLRRWEKQGLISSIRPNPHGHRRYHPEDLDRLLAQTTSPAHPSPDQLKKLPPLPLSLIETAFHQIFTHAQIGAAVTDSNGSFLHLNPAYEKILGYSKDQLLSMNFADLIHPDDKAANLKLVQKLIRGQIPDFTLENRYLHSDGSAIWIRKSVTLLHCLEKDTPCMIALIEDITSKVQAEQALQDKEAQLRLMIRLAPTAIYEIDFQRQRFTRVNNAMCYMSGYTRQELLTMDPFDILDDAGKVLFKTRLESWLQGKKPPQTVEFGILTKSGKKIYVELNVTFKKDAHGRPWGAFVVAHDVTQRKKDQEALRQEKEQFQKLINSIPIMISIYDHQVKINYFNRYLEDITGWTTKEAAQVDIMEKLYPDPLIRAETQAFVDSLSDEWKDIPMTTKSGDIIESSWRNIRLSKDLRVGIGVDIGERKKLERQKDEFVGVVSHELKTPVTSLKAYAQVLQRLFTKRGESQSVEYLAKMESQIDKLTTLINDLLDVTRIEAGKLKFRPTTFNFNQLVQETVNHLQLTTDTHQIQTKLAPSRQIKADRDRLEQVIINLLSNAIKYSPDVKKIVVTTTSSPKAVTLSVKDFGIGIPPSKQKHIFQKFFRAGTRENKSYPGLGLGLYISAQIIQRHHGTIWFKSQPGKGSIFSFTLPLKKQ